MKTFFRMKNWTLVLLCVSLLGSGRVSANTFSEEVEQLLQQKLRLIEAMVANPVLVALVKKSNRDNQGLSLGQILKIDKAWQTVLGIDDFIAGFISNECADLLKVFQSAYVGFVEIFVSDARGLIVGETNKTSDYYQADEDWWVKAFNQGRGKSYYGDIEYDASAHAEAIALYVPVLDPETQQVIGVVKAVYDFNAIIMEL